MVTHLVIDSPEEMTTLLAMLLEGEHTTFLRGDTDSLTISCHLGYGEREDVLNSPEIANRLEQFE